MQNNIAIALIGILSATLLYSILTLISDRREKKRQAAEQARRDAIDAAFEGDW